MLSDGDATAELHMQGDMVWRCPLCKESSWILCILLWLRAVLDGNLWTVFKAM